MGGTLAETGTSRPLGGYEPSTPNDNELSQLSIDAAKITRLTRRLCGNASDYTSEGALWQGENRAKTAILHGRDLFDIKASSAFHPRWEPAEA